MSTLYLGSDIEQLARRLAGHLDPSAGSRDFFQPVTIVVPHQAVGQWLKLWLARQQGVAINLQFLYLEKALWEMLHPSIHGLKIRRPNCSTKTGIACSSWPCCGRIASPGLETWQTFLQHAGNDSSRLYNRRLWHLADQLSTLIRNYEYHRQDAFIQHWLRGELAMMPGSANLERAQRSISGDHAACRTAKGPN